METDECLDPVGAIKTVYAVHSEYTSLSVEYLTRNRGGRRTAPVKESGEESEVIQVVVDLNLQFVG